MTSSSSHVEHGFSPRPRSGPASLTPHSLSRRLPRYRLVTAVLLLALVVGSALRLLNFAPIGWIPDTYERLSVTQAFLNDFDASSKLYPPGPVILLAPFFAVLPNSLNTVALAVSLFGIATILSAFFVAKDVTNRRDIALLYAAAIAVEPNLIYGSRSTAFDTIAAFLALSSLIMISRIRGGRSFLAYALLGILLATLVDFRFTYAALLPAFFFYRLKPIENRLRWRDILGSLLSLPVAATASAFLTCMAVFSWLSGSLSPGSATSAISLERFAPNLAGYWAQMLHGPVGVAFLAPLALLGFARLRRIDPSFACFSLYVLVSWPILFSIFTFYSYRYMLWPALFLDLFVVMAISELWTRKESFANGLAGNLMRAYGKGASALAGIAFVVISTALVINWPSLARESDEGLLEEMRPIVSSLGGEPLVVSAASRGFYDSPGKLEFLDLIDLWIDRGSGPAAQEFLNAMVQQALNNQQQVYYLYSRYEAGKDFHGHGLSRFQNFFDSVSRGFSVEEVYRTERRNLNSVNWILYRIRPKEP